MLGKIKRGWREEGKKRGKDPKNGIDQQEKEDIA